MLRTLAPPLLRATCAFRAPQSSTDASARSTRPTQISPRLQKMKKNRNMCQRGRPIKKGDEWDTETTWHRVSAFSFADARPYASGQLGKGAQVIVEGRIRVRKDEESGRSFTDIVADKVDVIRAAARPEGQH
ncbi:hypothetical protein BC830DRAFT_297575 [Chytriomyces sp. MP71]|nr:hypothetical protein BC830DRAFT_297575 [Chytriomyces sp. MP71]